MRCGKISSAARQRLLADKRLREYYNSTLKEGGSDLFGVPVTPAISRNRKRKVSQKSDDSVRKRVYDSSQTKPKAVTYKLDVHEENSEDFYDNRTRFNELLTMFMVKHMLPFSLLSRQPGSDDFFSSSQLRVRHLDNNFLHREEWVTRM
ncbi:hypothetical protein BWQ96_05879 [Gracilariopsis chorda]|uniref:Uncharacterized protein n=1 Tax=Gracilariopsis chorda TaxID=448386 RepID=A0A2V3IQK1_9FLOR|nr:hypothetical protein BWQ96_05879 [Gracilariopsis chorda]|eukprot:PXF44359.1 hypothetical protein BWQ96_05879 [Gracilariopsis chorda]